MFTFSIFGRKNDSSSTRRPRICRRSPLVEALEGRQLLSALGGGGVGQHIGVVVSESALGGGGVGQHIG
jgi:hypothetical protein